MLISVACVFYGCFLGIEGFTSEFIEMSYRLFLAFLQLPTSELPPKADNSLKKVGWDARYEDKGIYMLSRSF